MQYFALIRGKKKLKSYRRIKNSSEAIAPAEEIKEAYLKRDLAVIERTQQKKVQELLGAIKRFDKAELTFSSKWVEIEKTSVSIKIAWSGKMGCRRETAESAAPRYSYLKGASETKPHSQGNPFRQPGKKT